MCSTFLAGKHNVRTIFIDFCQHEDLDHYAYRERQRILQPLSLLGPGVRLYECSSYWEAKDYPRRITDTSYLTTHFDSLYMPLKAALRKEVEALCTFRRLAAGIGYLIDTPPTTSDWTPLGTMWQHPLVSPAQGAQGGVDAVREKLMEHDRRFWLGSGWCDEQWEREAMSDLRELEGMGNRIDVEWLARESAEEMGWGGGEAEEGADGVEYGEQSAG
ncbi:hypothetical protein LTR78_010900 [Recurvomyces mirabilis]|uniref:Uncharacterized protein n=1 Tax=Recurvomyces mirabilis TaxID=574656 RepID=A0AAE0TR93_9PEZI|nr:hypothetical protein LTR78_010900 [Recurvomyces mirabilis]KAK5151701.1 hypothetical protein LTS14_009188 [Recurvomyces mirabilis]